MDIGPLIDSIAGRYAARCWWADLNDLRQEGWVAALEAQHTWRPDGGAGIRYYTWRAAALRLRNYLWAAGSPVTGPKNNGHKLRGITAVSLDLLHDQSGNLTTTEMAEAWWAALATQVELVVEAGHRGDIAARALLHGEKAADIAEDVGCSVHTVWRARSAAKLRIAMDIDLRDGYMMGTQLAQAAPGG